MPRASGIVGGVDLSMDYLEDTGANRVCAFLFEFVRDRAGFLLSGIVTERCYRLHLESHVRSTIKFPGESIKRKFRRSARIFASISCRQLRRCDGSIDIGCLRYENGWVWLGGRQCLATPDDVIARFVSVGLSDCSCPVLAVKSQLNRNRGIFNHVAVDGRWGLRRRRSRENQKRYRKNTHGGPRSEPRSGPGAISPSIRGWPSQSTMIRYRLSLITARKFNRGRHRDPRCRGDRRRRGDDIFGGAAVDLVSP